MLSPDCTQAQLRYAPFRHILCFSKTVMVHSGPGGVIKRATLTGFVGVQEEVALKPPQDYPVIHLSRASACRFLPCPRRFR
jgi:hypothetical protein